MKIIVSLALAAGSVVVATPARADTPAPLTLVARYTFEAGVVGGRIADSSGRGPALTVRTADGGAVQFPAGADGGRFAAFPPACPAVTGCPRVFLEGAGTADLNPGTRLFRWSARVLVTPDQVDGSSNVVQKGVSGPGGEWKLQIGAHHGRAQCVVAGTQTTGGYVVRSAVAVTDGRWHKILCQRSGTALTVSVDDVLSGTATIPATLSVSNDMPMRVGGANFENGDLYHGLLDDVYVELG